MLERIFKSVRKLRADLEHTKANLKVWMERADQAESEIQSLIEHVAIQNGKMQRVGELLDLAAAKPDPRIVLLDKAKEVLGRKRKNHVEPYEDKGEL